MKELSRVLNALSAGAMTSTECAEVTGLTVKRCSSYLSELARCGVIHKTGRQVRYAARCHASYCYEVTR